MWHRALVVADQDSTFGGRPAQYGHVIKPINERFAQF
jgi:hypothetical protein